MSDIWKDQPFRMWGYWLEDKGLTKCVEDYYEDAFKSDPILARAYAMVVDGKTLINKRMEELEDQEPEEC